MLNAQYQFKLIEAGCDEVGRGCIAGPVVAAAVILPPDYKNKFIIDSKKISQKKRKELDQEIIDNAISWSISEVSNKKIDEIISSTLTPRIRASGVKITLWPRTGSAALLMSSGTT